MASRSRSVQVGDFIQIFSRKAGNAVWNATECHGDLPWNTAWRAWNAIFSVLTSRFNRRFYVWRKNKKERARLARQMIICGCHHQHLGNRQTFASPSGGNIAWDEIWDKRSSGLWLANWLGGYPLSLTWGPYSYVFPLFLSIIGLESGNNTIL